MINNSSLNNSFFLYKVNGDFISCHHKQLKLNEILQRLSPILVAIIQKVKMGDILKDVQIGYCKGKVLTVFIVLSFLIRLILGGDRDILALNQPYDDYWFVSSALHWIYGGHYSHMAFAQLPVYSMWLKGVSLLGISARLAIDLAWLISSASLGFAVARLLKSVWPGVVIYIFLAFHPYSFVLFDRALSENLLAVVSALAIAGLIELWNLRSVPCIRDWRRICAICVTALSCAIAYHTRKEGIVLLPPLLLLAFLSFLKRDVFWNGDSKFRLGYPMIVIPLVAILFFGVLLAGTNYLRWGVFTRYELAASGYTRAVNDLIAIDPSTSTPKYVTITAQTRNKAYAQSPTFSELKPFLDGPMGQEVAKYSSTFSGVPGEIANGWFYWTIRDAAAAAGWHVNASMAEQKYKAMAQELENAFSSGQLPKRWVILPFVDPDWAKWMPDLPGALVGEVRQLVDPTVANLVNEPAEDATEIQYDKYVSLVGRRSPLPRFSIKGWMTFPRGTSIGLGNNTVINSWEILQGVTRPDVPGALSFSLSSPSGKLPTELWVRQLNDVILHIPLISLQEGAMKAIPDSEGVLIGVDILSNNMIEHRADILIMPISKLWSWFGWIYLATGFFALRIVPGSGAMKQSAIPVIAALILIAMLTRIILLAILDSSSWSGQQTRYLLPALPFFAVFGTLGIWSALGWLTQKRR